MEQKITAKIIKELIMIQKASDILSKKVFSWEKRIVAQGTQKAMLMSV